jgi:hypothetical protein
MTRFILERVLGRTVIVDFILLISLAPFVAAIVGNASNSKEFFSLLTQPGIQTIYLTNDISLVSEDAPAQPVNLTANLSIVAGLPWPQVASLAGPV